MSVSCTLPPGIRPEPKDACMKTHGLRHFPFPYKTRVLPHFIKFLSQRTIRNEILTKRFKLTYMEGKIHTSWPVPDNTVLLERLNSARLIKKSSAFLCTLLTSASRKIHCCGQKTFPLFTPSKELHKLEHFA